VDDAGGTTSFASLGALGTSSDGVADISFVSFGVQVNRGSSGRVVIDGACSSSFASLTVHEGDDAQRDGSPHCVEP